ncbi:hypothetical protein BpHYR1_043265 [Brachionus plicatilis]|uniref:Uncharacterized protein n=1 Tax=Brachionus plicatilis TaxID=10195 RepID=A0A3M7P9I3_BRAPC|nr:hypothetical protein BpHYR1_043265 [Brachionus plicatilis]
MPKRKHLDCLIILSFAKSFYKLTLIDLLTALFFQKFCYHFCLLNIFFPHGSGYIVFYHLKQGED